MALINFLKPTIGKIILFLLLMAGINGFIIGSVMIFDAVVLVGVPLGFWPTGSWYLPSDSPPPSEIGFSWLNFLLDAVFWYAVASGVVTIYQLLGQYKKWFLIMLGVAILVIIGYVMFVFNKPTESPFPINMTDFSPTSE